jgi:hypothetical protein
MSRISTVTRPDTWCLVTKELILQQTVETMSVRYQGRLQRSRGQGRIVKTVYVSL